MEGTAEDRGGAVPGFTAMFKEQQGSQGLEPTVLELRSHTWSQDLMRLRFLMSHRRKNLVRNKVIGKKWIYLERNSLYRVLSSLEGEASLKIQHA